MSSAIDVRSNKVAADQTAGGPVAMPANERTGIGPILLVEDSRTQAAIMQDGLEARGYRTAWVADICSALAWLENNAPYLMVLDYQLPDGEGCVLIDALAASSRRVPFIVTTARGSESIAVDMMKRGALDYLVKDSKIADNLGDAVGRIVRQLQAEQALADVRRSLQQAEHRTRQVIDAAPEAFVSVDQAGKVVHWNPAAEKMFGYRQDDILHSAVTKIVPRRFEPTVAAFLAGFPKSPTPEDLTNRFESCILHRDGREVPVEVSAFPVRANSNWVVSAFIHDITERRRLEAQLVQSEKMASLGVLAAGVAHEINNPIGFVTSNLGTLSDYVSLFVDNLTAYQALTAAQLGGDAAAVSAARTQIDALNQRENLDFVRGDVTSLLAESTEGLKRVKEIVQNLRSFARLDEAEIKEADINECLETTLKVVSNELKYKAEIIKDLKPLPPLRCCAGQLNQVFVNLLVNAGQAIKDRGRIEIHSFVEAENIVITVSDTGEGILPENLSRLFTPFFTTKGVGKGTGLGLSISYGIVQKHGGTIEAVSRVGEGSTFTIHLPVKGIV